MQQKIERMQEGVSLAQGEKKHLAGQQLTPRYEVVQQLKDARKAQDMTQEVLAERVGTKKSNISRFESGKYNPSLDFLIKVAGSLGKQVQIRIKCRSVTLGNGRDIDKDIELCRTTNEKTSEQTIHVLMENHIPFTKSWINIPFFLRRKFHGASQICVINTNRNRYSQARTAIDQMDIHFKKRLVVSNY